MRRVFVLVALLSIAAIQACAKTENQKYGYLNKRAVDELLVGLRAATDAKDPEAFAQFIRFPLKCKVAGKDEVIVTKADFIQRFSELIPDLLKNKIMEPREMTWNWSGVKIGRGEIWIRGKEMEPEIVYLNTDVDAAAKKQLKTQTKRVGLK